jgi:hypothetical protein
VLIGGLLAVGVNVTINALVGHALYGGIATVPLSGDAGVAGDTIIGAFLIAFFTVLVVAPATRREVRSGRVRGGGTLALPGWFVRRPVLAALAGGVVSATLVGGGAVAIIATIDAAPMSGDAFLAFKIAFAGVWGGLAAVIVAALAAAGESAPPDDDRWCRDPEHAVAVSYPFDYIDKGGLAVTSARHGCSGTPTWQLVVSGVPDPAAVRAALGDLLLRYPVLTTRVQSLDAVPEYARRFRYAAVAPPDLASMFELVDLRGRPPGELEALVQDACDRHLDQFREAPISLTMAITDEDTCRLLFRQHHGIADGRAFIGLLGDFATFLRARENGAAPEPAALEPIGRRAELDALGLSPMTRARYGLAGFASLTGSIVKALVRRPTILVQNDSADYTGKNGAVRWIVDDATLDAWNAARRQLGVSQTALFTAALFVATQRWHRELGRRLGRVNASIVMETRPRDGGFVSFANHLATLEVELQLARTLEPADTARAIHAQLKRQLDRKRPFKRLVCERGIVLGMPLDKLQAIVFDAKRPAFNLNLSNLIALDFPVLSGRAWAVDEVLITTPVTPRNGVALTVVRYNGRVCFNFNYAASAVTAAQTTELERRFREALETLVARES